MVELTTPYFLIPPTVNFQHTMFNHAVVTNSITNETVFTKFYVQVTVHRNRFLYNKIN